MSMFKRLWFALVIAVALAPGQLAAQVAQSKTLTNTTCPGDGCLVLPTDGFGSALVQLVVSGTATAVVEVSINGQRFDDVAMNPVEGGSAVASVTGTGGWTVNVAGAVQTRVRLTGCTNCSVVALMNTTRSGGGSSGGGSSGTEYTEGATDTTLTGPVLMWEDTGDAVVAASAAKPLPVNIISGAGSGGTAATDDSAFTVATTNVTVAGCIEATDSMDAGDLGGMKCGADRELDVDVMSLPITFDAGAVGATTPRVTLGSDDPAVVSLAALDNAVSGSGFNISQLAGAAVPLITTQADNQAYTTDALAVAAFMYCSSGTDFDMCPASTGGAGTIDANTSRVTIATDDDVSDMATLIEAMMVAHDVPDAGNGFKIAGVATSSIVGDTPVADADRTNLYAGLDGVLITRPHSNLEDRVNPAPVGITDGSSTSVVAAQGAGVRFCATTIVVSNSSATNVTVDIRDGTAGTVMATIPAAANMGGGVVPLQTPICTTANTALAADPSAAASTVTVTAVGFKTEL